MTRNDSKDTEGFTDEKVSVDDVKKPLGLTPEISIDSSNLDYQKNKEDFEKQFIEEALKRNKGMLNQTALQANIPKKTLQRKIQKYDIDISNYKSSTKTKK